MSLHNGITPDEFVRLSGAAGIPAKISSRSEEAVIVELQIHGFVSIAVLLAPTRGLYNSVQLWIGWRDALSPEEANRWNAARRYAYAFCDEEGQANLQLDFSVVGIEDNGVMHYVGLWAHMIALFVEEMSGQ